MRRLLAFPLLMIAQPGLASELVVSPLFGTQLRYEQYATDRLISVNDAIQFRARPGIALSSGPWSFDAVSNAAVAVRRGDGGSNDTRATRPEAVNVDELKLEFAGLPRTAISVGRQHLGIAGAALTGDRDGEQTFDAARIRWSAAGITADLAYAWSSSSLWAATQSPLPASVAGENLFAQIKWQNPAGTLSGYAYQIDQRNAADGNFRLLNQIYGARFSGSRQIDEKTSLAYSLGYVRQTGSLANAVSGAPTYWQIGSRFDFGDMTATQTSYRRFAANGITTLNGDTLSLATSATRGKMTVGATYKDFRPVAAAPARDVRISLAMIF